MKGFIIIPHVLSWLGWHEPTHATAPPGTQVKGQGWRAHTSYEDRWSQLNKQTKITLLWQGPSRISLAGAPAQLMAAHSVLWLRPSGPHTGLGGNISHSWHTDTWLVDPLVVYKLKTELTPFLYFEQSTLLQFLIVTQLCCPFLQPHLSHSIVICSPWGITKPPSNVQLFWLIIEVQMLWGLLDEIKTQINVYS